MAPQQNKMRSSAGGSASSAYTSSDEASNGRHSPPSLSGLCNDLGLNRGMQASGGLTSNEQKLLDLQDRTGYEITQRNGQRIYGPPPDWVGEPPSKGSEIFVGRVPRDCYEPELVPVFSKVSLSDPKAVDLTFSPTLRLARFTSFA